MNFLTDTGIFVPAVTADQMREIDRIVIEETGPNLFQMMENAGRGLASVAIGMLGHGWQKARVVVLAGTGGNGGGGICAARHLANRNVNVRLCMTKREPLSPVASYQGKVFQSTSGREVFLPMLDEEPVDLIVDAVIGYGLQASPQSVALDFIRWANQKNAPILALDVPSGVDSTTGITRGEFMRVSATMTLAVPKKGLLPEKTGQLFLADIGISPVVYQRMRLEYSVPFDDRFVVPLSFHS